VSAVLLPGLKHVFLITHIKSPSSDCCRVDSLRHYALKLGLGERDNLTTAARRQQQHSDHHQQAIIISDSTFVFPPVPLHRSSSFFSSSFHTNYSRGSEGRRALAAAAGRGGE